MIVVLFSGMSIRVFILCISILPVFVHGQLTFSEVMFDPATDENHDEYVEIHNLSITDSANLSGYRFSDGTGTDQLLPMGKNYKLPPGGFAVLLDGSYPENSVTYDSVLVGMVSIYLISDRAFGSNGLSNSNDECLLLIDTTGDTVAKYCYSTDNLPGFPDEKILLQGPDTPDNWSNGQIKGGTPGRRNSVSPFELDAGFQKPGILLPPVMISGQVCHLTVLIENYGLSQIESRVTLKIFLDDPGNQLLDSVFSLIGDRLAMDVSLDFGETAAGEHTMDLALTCPDDQNPTNNVLRKTITLYQIENSLAINEVKFLTEEEEPEWIELFNYGPERVYLKGWMIADANDTASIDTAYFIEPGSYMVISEGSLSDYYGLNDNQLLIIRALPVLNNESDEISLIKPDGAWHERVNYSQDWLQNEVIFKPSLERIHPSLYAGSSRNWGPCVAQKKATPGAINSIFAAPLVSVAGLEAHPNPFSPDGDGREDATLISGWIPERSARLKLVVFDIRGRVIRTIRENRFTGNRFDVVWDGLDDEGRTARMGIYIIFAQAIDELAGVLREMKTTVVLAKPL